MTGAALSACDPGMAGGNAPQAAAGGGEAAAPEMLKVRVGGETFRLELALDDETRTLGLGGREEIPRDGGMLFVFPQAAQLSFVMRDFKQNLFSSSIRRPVEVDQNLTRTVEGIIIKKLTNLISIARKAKQAVFGFEKVRSQLELKNAKLLIQARDGSSREKSRLRPPAGENSLINCLTMDELGLAFGRENVIHATIMNGGLYKEISLEALRIEGIREINSCQSIQKDEHTYE